MGRIRGLIQYIRLIWWTNLTESGVSFLRQRHSIQIPSLHFVINYYWKLESTLSIQSNKKHIFHIQTTPILKVEEKSCFGWDPFCVHNQDLQFGCYSIVIPFQLHQQLQFKLRKPYKMALETIGQKRKSNPSMILPFLIFSSTG